MPKLAVVLLPLLTLALQWVLVPLRAHSVWFLFYPAVFISSWLGHRFAGLVAAVVSAFLVIGVLLPPGPFVFPAVILVLTGMAFDIFHGRFRRSNTRLAAIIEQASDGIFLADLDGRYIDVNATGCSMLGYSREELVGKTILDLLASDERTRFLESKADIWEGRTRTDEFHLRRKDGTFLVTEVSAKLLPEGRWQAIVRDISERKRLERQLQESYADLNWAQSVAAAGSWRLDVQRNVLVWSDESYRIFGLPQGTPMTYEKFLAIVHSADRALVDERWQAALRGEPYDIEHRIVTPSGEKWVRERAEIAFDEAGKLVGGIGTTQDVTSRKNIEEALREAHVVERNLRQEIEQVTQASLAISEAVATVTSADISAVFQTVALQAQALTDATYAALGVSKTSGEEPFDPWVFVGMSDDTAKRIGRYPRPVGILGAVVGEGAIIRIKDVHRHPAFQGLPVGHPPLSSFMGVPITFRGAPVGNLFLANKRNAPEFTEHDERVIRMLAARVGVAIETAILYKGETLQRVWLQTVINQMPGGVILLDAAGRVTGMNDSARAMALPDTGPKDPYGNPILFDIRKPDGSPLAFEEIPLVRALRQGEVTKDMELLLRQRDGRFVTILANAAPVRDDRQAVTGATVLFSDITALKELERLREEWAAIVAHDLRQPVSVIGTAVELLTKLREGHLTPGESKVFRRIQAASGRLNLMINDLLEASQVEAHRLALNRRSCDLGAFLHEAVEQQSHATSGFKVAVSAATGENAWIDPDRMQQVLDNLLSNAAKYGKPGSEIQVKMVGHAQEFEVIVANQGTGIEPGDIPKLFSRFARTHGVRGIPGLGLGLYISRGLIEAHGGRMWAESTPGETTRFCLTVPRYRGDAESLAEAPARLQSDLTARDLGGGA